jgi:hypothetical protein
MSLDLQNSYKDAQETISSQKSYNEVRAGMDRQSQIAGDTFEQAKKDVTGFKNQIASQTKSFQRDLPSQIDQLVNLASMAAGGKYANITQYLKKVLIKTLIDVRPKINEILEQEFLNAIGCSQQQSYTPQPVWIPVQSIDLGGILKINPKDKIGKITYEKDEISVGSIPFSMNRELYNRIQNQPNSYSTEYSLNYKGTSGQELFDIEYTTIGENSEPGQFFKVTLKSRLNNKNNVFEFVKDYYSTIKVVDLNNIVKCILESMTGAISMDLDPGVEKTNDESRTLLLIQRILGLCFDNESEIAVGGNKKIAELDGVDDTFFEFTEIDQRKIDQRLVDIKDGVVTFEDCNNVRLPLNYFGIIEGINDINLVEGNAEKTIVVIDAITTDFTKDPRWGSFSFDPTIGGSVDLDFIKKMTHGLVFSLLSPKILLPIMLMQKSLGKYVKEKMPKSYNELFRKLKKFIINVTSKIGSLIVEQIFDTLVKDIKNLLQVIIQDVIKENHDVQTAVILKLVQLLIVVGEFIRDYRKCKSVIDEILWLLKIATSGIKDFIPLPLLFASSLLGGASAASAFRNTIKQMKKMGIPTGAMPSGAPNLELASKYATIKGMMDETKINGKVQVAIPSLTVITPIGPLKTIPNRGTGKSL